MCGCKKKYTCCNKHGEEGINEGEAGWLINGQAECLNESEAGCLNEGEGDDIGDEVFLPIVMQHKDIREHDVLGFNNDDVMDHADNVAHTVRDAECQGMYTKAVLARLKTFVGDSKNPSILIVRSTRFYSVTLSSWSWRKLMVGPIEVPRLCWLWYRTCYRRRTLWTSPSMRQRR